MNSQNMKIIAVLAVFCILAGTAYAVGKLIPSVDQELCTGCGMCVDKCPAGAISIGEDGKAVVDESLCTNCGKCTKVCPFEAVRAEQAS